MAAKSLNLSNINKNRHQALYALEAPIEMFSYVNVAQRATAQGVENVTNLHRLAVDSQVERLVDRGIAGGRLVLQRQGTGDLVCLGRVERLPDPIDPIKHSVMKEKGRVVDGRVEISRVTAHSVVT
jgi:hypothetical protein